MRFPRTATGEDEGIALTPLVDVVFLLLIFFLVATSFDEPRLTLELPDAETAEAAERLDALRVEIRRGGELRVDGQAIEAGDLDRVFGERAVRITSVELRADREVSHGRVVEVLDRARAHGLREVSIAVEARAESP